MKKQLLIFLLLLLCIARLHSQNAPFIEWQKSFGGSDVDEATSIQQTTDGGYIVAGTTQSYDGDVSGNHDNGWNPTSDFWIVKLDSTGNIQWQKCAGGTNNDWGYSIQQTSDGGYIVVGASGSEDGDVSVNYGYIDCWIVKLDASGSIQWQKPLGGSLGEFFYSVQETPDGGYIVAGYTNSNDGWISGNNGSYDYWIIKFDSSGNVVWQKLMGGTASDVAKCIRQTTDGGFIVAGYSSSSFIGSENYWIVKLDSSGNTLWEKTLGGSSYDEAYSIQQTTDGGFIAAGFSWSSDGDVSFNHSDPWGYPTPDYWIVKLDEFANIQWEKSLGGGDYDEAYSVQQTNDGGFIVAGSSTSNDGDVSVNHGSYDYWIVKLDSSGTIQWQKSLGGGDSEVANSIQQTTDGGLIIAGFSYSVDGDVSGNQGNMDYWIVKLSANASTTCSTSFTLVADSLIPHHYWLLPFVEGDSPITYLWNWGDGSTDTAAYPSHTYDTAGFYNICLYTVDSTGCSDTSCIGFELQKSEQMNSIITVNVVASIPVATGGPDPLLVLSVYPNPAQSQLIIPFAMPAEETTIQVFDLYGRMISLPVSFHDNKAELDIRTLSAGLYMIQITDERSGKVEAKTFVKSAE